jgi:hypothetical protein
MTTCPLAAPSLGYTLEVIARKEMKAEISGPDTLSIHRSFIVRLYPGVDPGAGEISGWVEHVVSGEAREFRSVEELLRFIGQLLRRDDSGSELKRL